MKRSGQGQNITLTKSKLNSWTNTNPLIGQLVSNCALIDLVNFKQMNFKSGTDKKTHTQTDKQTYFISPCWTAFWKWFNRVKEYVPWSIGVLLHVKGKGSGGICFAVLNLKGEQRILWMDKTYWHCHSDGARVSGLLPGNCIVTQTHGLTHGQSKYKKSTSILALGSVFVYITFKFLIKY